MKIFISGPMTGIQNFNKQSFMMAEARLRLMGHSPFNPSWLNFDKNWTSEEMLTVDLAALSVCDGIYLLEGWEDSKGANVEYDYAVEKGKKIFYAGNENDMKKLRKLEAV
nr:MAG TPA: protein of unknown function (DUF4406) [Caudoviricetes sp.]